MMTKLIIYYVVLVLTVTILNRNEFNRYFNYYMIYMYIVLGYTIFCIKFEEKIYTIILVCLGSIFIILLLFDYMKKLYINEAERILISIYTITILVIMFNFFVFKLIFEIYNLNDRYLFLSINNIVLGSGLYNKIFVTTYFKSLRYSKTNSFFSNLISQINPIMIFIIYGVGFYFLLQSLIN